MIKEKQTLWTQRKVSSKQSQETLELRLAVESDKTTGEVLAVYFSIRSGKSATVKEFGNGIAYADYDRKGRLLGIELLGPCQIAVLDKISRKESMPVQKFLRNAVPREMAIA